MGAPNTLLLKVNQTGTLTEGLGAASCATKNGYGVLVSERSAQTEDTWLADLTVGLNAGQERRTSQERKSRAVQSGSQDRRRVRKIAGICRKKFQKATMRNLPKLAMSTLHV